MKIKDLIKFWRWPTAILGLYKELEDLKVKHEALKADYERLSAGQVKLLEWVKTTHRLHRAPDGIRALLMAGKRLVPLLMILFISHCLLAQPAPPIQRNPFTTNMHFGPVPTEGQVPIWNDTVKKWSNNIISGGGGVGFGSLLWTNEPSGRIRPVEFTNRVEVQRSITIGTNSAVYAGAPNSNDFFFAYRDITKGERYGPKFGLGVISNTISATIDAVLQHNHAGWNVSAFDEGGNQAAITIDAIANASGPTFIMVRTNTTVPFGVSGTNITLHNVQYTFPQAQGAAGTVLTNNGAGVLGWGSGGGGGTGNVAFSDLVWTNNLGQIYTIVDRPRIEFRTNQILGRLIRADGTNTALGSNAMGLFSVNAGSRITAIGTDANAAGGGMDSVFIGHRAGYSNSSGAFNVAIGFEAMEENEFRSDNVAIGYQSLQGFNTGHQNTAVGAGTMDLLATSYNGTALGWGALDKMEGIGNTALGAQAMLNAQGNGNYNLAAGYEPLENSDNIEGNVAIGQRAMWSVDNITNTVTLGFQATTIVSPLTNAVGIGALSRITADNQMMLGTNITRYVLRNVDYLFPSTNGLPGQVLTAVDTVNRALAWSNAPSGGGGGTVAFSDLVWTNDNGTIKPVAFPTNILLTVNVPDNGTGTNFYFDSRVYRTNAASKLFAIYNGGSNAVTVGPHGGLFIGRGNQTPFPGAVLYGIYDRALGETNQQEIFIQSKNSAVGYNGAASVLVDTNYGAMILYANKEGGTKFARLSFQAGAGENPQDFNTFTMQGLVDGATYFQVDPNFTSLTPTNYLFSSSVRITNTHTLMSLQNSNTPVLEVDGVGDLRMIKRIPYLWPSAQGAAATVLTNNGAGVLGWGAVAATGGGSGITNLFSLSLSNSNLKPIVFGGVGTAAGMTNTTGQLYGLEAGSGITLSPNGSNVVITSTSSGGIGDVDIINLSAQAGKLPATNYPYIDAGYQAWATVYTETNELGARTTLSSSWQFLVPTNYSEGSLKLLINYSLLSTNGPNTSNVVWGASVLSIRSGTTNDVQTNAFGPVVKGSNDWIGKYDGANIVTNLLLDLGAVAGLQDGDLALIKLERYAAEDTYGQAVSLHGLQVWYTNTSLGGGGGGDVFGMSNIFSATLSNATIKPLVVGVGNAAGATNSTGEIRGLEAGVNMVITANGSNYVLTSTGGVWTDDGQTIYPVLPNVRALRQGITNGVQWMSTNIGLASVAFGSNNTAGGFYSSVLGGAGNSVGTNTRFNVIVGGFNNTLLEGWGYNFIGGGEGNFMDPGTSNSTIVAGHDSRIFTGAFDAFVGGGDANYVHRPYGAVVGGQNNEARAQFSFVGGGHVNVAGDDGTEIYATVVGGDGNIAGAEGMFIGGGAANGGGIAGDSATYAVIVGGLGNNTDSASSVIVGGERNVISSSSPGSFIGGGITNLLLNSSPFSAILGGVSNRIAASTHNATIIGSFQTNTMPNSVLIGTDSSNLSNVRISITNLHLHGDLAILMTNGAGSGKVLTSDGQGRGTWQAGGAAASGITNLISLSLSNATLKPIVFGGVGTAAAMTNTTGQIYGLEAGGNVTITPNGSNLVIAASVSGSGISTNGNQFGASVELTLKDGAFLTNAVNFGAGFRGAVTNIMTAPQFLGTNVVFDGSLSSWFQFNVATGPQTNYVFTNIQAGQTIRVSTFVTNGSTVRVWANTTEIPASWYVGNNGSAWNLNSNAPSVLTVTRDPLIPATNVMIWSRDLEVVAGSGMTFTTNFPAGTVTFASTGGSGSLATNANQFGAQVVLTIKDSAFLTNLNVESSLQVSNGHTYLAGPVTNLTQLNLPHLTVSRSAVINAQGDVTNSSADANWSLYPTNVWNSRQGGSLTLTNLAGTGAITNLFTPSLSNATIKPIVFGGVGTAAGMTNVTGQLFGLEAGTGVTLTPNPSNIVISTTAGGLAFSDLVWTNDTITIYPTRMDRTVLNTNGFGFGEGELRITNGIGGGRWVDSPGAYIKSVTGAVVVAYFDKSTNAWATAALGGYAGGRFTNSTKSYAGAFDAAVVTAYIRDSTNSNIQSYGAGFSTMEAISSPMAIVDTTDAGIFGALFNNSSNATVTGGGGAYGGLRTDYSPRFDFRSGSASMSSVFTERVTNGASIASFGSLIVGTLLGNNERFGAIGGSAAIGRDVTSVNSNTWSFGIHYTNGVGESFGVGFGSVTSLLATVDGIRVQDIARVKGVPYSWPSSQGSAQMVLTNDGSGNLGWNTDQTSAGGTVVFSDLVWTNDTGIIKPNAYPTNVLFNVEAANDSTSTNYYFDSRVYRTSPTGKLFAIYNGGSNALTVGPFGGIKIGRDNGSITLGDVFNVRYDTLLGEPASANILWTTTQSGVGYYGAGAFVSTTNFGNVSISSFDGAANASVFDVSSRYTNITFALYNQNASGIRGVRLSPGIGLTVPTNYLFNSWFRLTNIHTLFSLQNSNTPVFEVDGIGDLKLLKRVPYSWPVTQGAAKSVLTNNGSGVLGWGAVVVDPAPLTNLISLTLSNNTIKPLVVGVGDAAAATNVTGQIRGLEAGANITLTPNGSNYVIASTGGSGTPGGLDGSIQFNQDGTTFAGTNRLYYDRTNESLISASILGKSSFVATNPASTLGLDIRANLIMATGGDLNIGAAGNEWKFESTDGSFYPDSAGKNLGNSTQRIGVMTARTAELSTSLTVPALLITATVAQVTNSTVWIGTNGATGFSISSNNLNFVQHRLDLLNAVAFRTNQLDLKLNTYQAFTNSLRTNLVVQITNVFEGVTTRLDAYGSGRLGGAASNAWNMLFTASSGTTIYWPPGTTNGNYDVLVNSNQVVSFTFMGGLGSTNILASYRVLEGIGTN